MMLSAELSLLFKIGGIFRQMFGQFFQARFSCG
jgi:hypothetical protein